MRALARWSAAAAGSLAVFAACWAVCRYGAGLDTGTSLGVAAAPLAVALAVLGWWAAREPVRLAGAEGSITAEATGQRSEAVAGNLGVNIGGDADLRGAVINFAVGGRPLGAAPPHVGQAPAGPVVVGDIPRPPPAFQSRDCILAALREHPGERAVCVVHAITGMRGVGKTQAAAAYARERVTAEWRLVAWVNAETTATALDGLAETAAVLGIAGATDDQPAAARALRRWLEGGGQQCLVVFDNAPDPDHLRPYVPAGGQAQIVITSARESVSSLGTSVPVDVFTEAEALSYLAERTGSARPDPAGETAVASTGQRP
jgi:hypothetical protein